MMIFVSHKMILLFRRLTCLLAPCFKPLSFYIYFRNVSNNHIAIYRGISISRRSNIILIWRLSSTGVEPIDNRVGPTLPVLPCSASVPSRFVEARRY